MKRNQVVQGIGYALIFGAMLLAINVCRGARPINPQALAHQNACVASLQVNDYESAKTRCELCLEYDETVPECLNGLGLVAYARGDNATAIKYFSRAVQQSRDFAQARNNLGAVYFRDGNFSEALPLFRAAVEIDPGYQDARYNMALSYFRLGQKAFAVSDMQTAKANFDLAKEQYEKLIGVNAGYGSAHRDLALIWTYYASMENLEKDQLEALGKANTYFEQCLQIEPNNEACHQSFGHTLLYQNRYDDALYQFVQCLAANNKNSECMRGMDTAYQGSQIKSKALAGYIQQIKKNPKDAQGHYGYCKALFERDLNDMAVSECKTALQINPKMCAIYYDLGMYFKRALNSNEAYENCRTFLLCDQKIRDHEKVARCEEVVTTIRSPQ